MASDPERAEPIAMQRRGGRMAGAGSATGSAPRPVRWPSVDQAEPNAAASAHPGRAESRPILVPPALPLWMRASHLLPFLSMELSTALGLRLRLRLRRGGNQTLSDPAMLGFLQFREGRLLLAIDRDAAMELLAAVYGSDRAASPPETVMLSDLAPGNASWTAFGALVRAGAGRALQLAGAGAVESAAPTLADAKVPRTHVLPITLSGPALQVAMEMLFVPAEPAPKSETITDKMADPASAADTGGSRWGRQMNALSRAVPVPVTLELCAQEWPLAKVMALAAGDVIALPPVRSMVMKVAGTRWAEVPMTTLAGPTGTTETEKGQA